MSNHLQAFRDSIEVADEQRFRKLFGRLLTETRTFTIGTITMEFDVAGECAIENVSYTTLSDGLIPTGTERDVMIAIPGRERFTEDTLRKRVITQIDNHIWSQATDGGRVA